MTFLHPFIILVVLFYCIYIRTNNINPFCSSDASGLRPAYIYIETCTIHSCPNTLARIRLFPFIMLHPMWYHKRLYEYKNMN